MRRVKLLARILARRARRPSNITFNNLLHSYDIYRSLKEETVTLAPRFFPGRRGEMERLFSAHRFRSLTIEPFDFLLRSSRIQSNRFPEISVAKEFFSSKWDNRTRPFRFVPHHAARNNALMLPAGPRLGPLRPFFSVFSLLSLSPPFVVQQALTRFVNFPFFFFFIPSSRTVSTRFPVENKIGRRKLN